MIRKKQRLVIKFGGERRLLKKFIEEIDILPPIENRLEDLLKLAWINLRENKVEGMNSGFLWCSRMFKSSPQIITQNYWS